MNANESAVTFVSRGPNSAAAIVAAWNDARHNFAIGLSVLPSMWQQCTRVTCGAGGGVVALAIDQDLDGARLLPSYGGDPAIAGDDSTDLSGQGSGIVVAANISSSIVRGTCTGACPFGAPCVSTGELPPNSARGCAHPGDAIVAIASFDGGGTWGVTAPSAANDNSSDVIIVNEGNGPCDIFAPTQRGPSMWAGADRPHVTFERRLGSGPAAAAFWVEWAGTLNSSLCLRRVIADPVLGRLISPGPTRQVTTETVGDAIVRVSGAGDTAGSLFVMFADRFRVNPACGTPGSMSWTIAVSFSGVGDSWTYHRVTTSPFFDACFGAAGLAGFGNARGIFGFDIAPDGTLWAAVLDAQVDLRGRPRPGAPRGRTPIRVLHSTDGGMTWPTDQQLVTNAQVGHIELTADRRGNIAVSYYRAVPPSGTLIQRMVTIRDSTTGFWSFPTPISSAFSEAMSGNRVLGEYQGGTDIDPTAFAFGGGTETFYEVWTELDPVDPTVHRIAGARLGVKP